MDTTPKAARSDEQKPLYAPKGQFKKKSYAAAKKAPPHKRVVVADAKAAPLTRAPGWAPRVRRVLEIISTGGGVLLREPKPAKRH